jgi:hypothetical protein
VNNEGAKVVRYNASDAISRVSFILHKSIYRPNLIVSLSCTSTSFKNDEAMLVIFLLAAKRDVGGSGHA